MDARLYLVTGVRPDLADVSRSEHPRRRGHRPDPRAVADRPGAAGGARGGSGGDTPARRAARRQRPGRSRPALRGRLTCTSARTTCPCAAARGLGLRVGLSTHAAAEIDAADADYIGVGPVHATPTKEGRPAVGLDLVRYAAQHARQPWFAIGGIDETNVRDVVAAGATRDRRACARSVTRPTPSGLREPSGPRWAAARLAPPFGGPR